MARRHILSVTLLSLAFSNVINGQDFLGGGFTSFLPGLAENLALHKLGDMSHGFATEATGLTKNFGNFRDYFDNLRNFGKDTFSPLSQLPFAGQLTSLPSSFGSLPLNNLPFGKLEQLPFANILHQFSNPTAAEAESSGDGNTDDNAPSVE